MTDLCLTPAQEAINPTYLLAWIPESLLNEKGQNEWDKFVRIEEKQDLDAEDDGTWPQQLASPCFAYSPAPAQLDAVLIELPVARPESYAFSVPISSIYSLIVRPPSLSSWCKSLLRETVL